jgi:hypothetical protein
MPYPDSVEYSSHGAKRRIEYGYSRSEVRSALQHGDVIETYDDTGRGPSYLMLHWTETRPVHVVAADKTKPEKTIIITLYDPRSQADKWTDDYRQRQ